jgi:hypothetical protein
LYKHHKVKPYLLIDEYDTPIQSAYANNYYQEMADFMRDMFGECLKDNILPIGIAFSHKSVKVAYEK